MRAVATAFAVMLWPLVLMACAKTEAVVTIDPSVHHQVMRGWEVTTDMSDDDHPESVPLYREKLYDLAVSDVGINRVRFEVRSGAEGVSKGWERFMSGELSAQAWRPLRYQTVNDNDDPNVINWAGFDFSELDDSVDNIVLPMKRRVEQQGERLFLNLCYVAFTEQITTGDYHHDNPEEYAEFVLATYLHLQEKYGFVPDTWEVLLEPDNGTKQWNPTVMANNIVAAARRLKENGFTPAFVAPSTMDMARAVPWIEEIARTPGAMETIVEFSYHRYHNSNADNARKIAAAGKRYGKPTSMLEWWFKNATYEVLREDLVEAENSAWQGQVLRTLFDVDMKDPKAPKLSVASDTRMNLQYFRYIRMGAQRIGAESSDPTSTRPTAFINPDKSYVIVADTKGPVAMTIRGAPAGKYAVSYALKDRSVVEPTPVETDEKGEIVVNMPGQGVVTVSSVPSAAGG